MTASEDVVLQLRRTEGERPSIRWDDKLGRPAIGLVLTGWWRCAQVLVRSGKPAVRTFARDELIRWPDPGSREDNELRQKVQELVTYWQEEFEYGWDPARLETDHPDTYDAADRVAIQWLLDGELPGHEEMCFELAWPVFLEECTRWAEEHFAAEAEKSEADEEIASHQVKQWMIGTKPFASAGWLSRPGMFDAYSRWCLPLGRKPGKAADFYRSLEELGCKPSKRKGDNGFLAPSREITA